MAVTTVLTGAMTVYTAAADTAAPAVSAAPAGSWTRLGAAGFAAPDGVTVESTREVTEWQSSDALAPSDAWLAKHAMSVTVALADLSADALAHALGMDPTEVVDTAATTSVVGTETLSVTSTGLHRVALLVRGRSPYSREAWPAQWYLPRAVSVEALSLKYSVTEPAAWAVKFMALADAAGSLGAQYSVQTAAMLPQP